mmetsp:Transcript_29567/g.58188  ORF Transcript_29567/g.58188 Transcript_29567/m.58188 type:complete len:214 (+) Transcript_29567:2759-3400(+)
MLQQALRFGVGFSIGGDDDIHAPVLIHFIKVDFWEHDVLFQTGGEIATAVKARLHTTEVADAWHRNSDQTIEEFVHTVATQGHLGTHWHAFANAEASNGVLCHGGQSFLARNCGQICLCRLGFLAVLNGCTATADVQHDFFQRRDLHVVLVAELFFESGADGILVERLQTWGVVCVIKHQSRPLWSLRSEPFCHLPCGSQRGLLCRFCPGMPG